MQVFDLRRKTCFISVENLVMFYLVFHKVSRFIHLTQNNGHHLLALDCMNNNEFEKSEIHLTSNKL